MAVLQFRLNFAISAFVISTFAISAFAISAYAIIEEMATCAPMACSACLWEDAETKHEILANLTVKT